MGIGASHQTKLEQEFGGVGEGDDEERFFGFENFGNTCYCNSVLQVTVGFTPNHNRCRDGLFPSCATWATALIRKGDCMGPQALYFCEPLRQRLAELREELVTQGTGGAGSTSGGNSSGEAGSGSAKRQENSVLSQLAELFALISRQKRRSGSLAPTDFLRTLRERNELFRGNMQQDAHEFFNFVLNEMADSLVARRKSMEVAAKRQQSESERGQQPVGHQDGQPPQQGQRQQSQPKPTQAQQDDPAHPEERQQHPQAQQHQQSQDRRYPHQHHSSNDAPQDHKTHHPQSHLHHPDPRRSTRPKSKIGLKAGFGNGSKNGTSSGTELPPPPPASSTPSGAAEERRQSGDASTSKHGQQGVSTATSSRADGSVDGSGETWVHRIFQGVLTNQTKCLCCETVSNRDEPFMDLSLDVEQNSSVTACLKSFSSTETLTKKNKFFCENCNALQEAEKKIELKRLPRVLTLHLKRFKYVESLDNFSKLSHRVVFPLELRAPNVMDGPAEADADARLYRLFAVVVHIGRGPNHGHYVTVVKSGGRWILFDDDIVEHVSEQVLKRCFGLSRPATGATNTGYLLFYDCGEDGMHGSV